MSKPLPKSLHTVTVLIRVGAHFAALEGLSKESAIRRALELLGYENAPDTYALAAQAVRQWK